MKLFTIAKGEGSSSIAERLTNEGLINSKEAFLIYLRLNDKGGDIKFGDFQITPSMTTEQIIQILSVSPEARTATIQFIEGIRYTEILTTLESQLTQQGVNLDFVLMKDIFDNPDKYYEQMNETSRAFLQKYKPAGKNLEGFLFPDKYEVFKTVKEIQIVDLLITTLSKKLSVQDYEDIAKSKYPFYDILKIASYVEREANNDVDYPIVAGIFYRRLQTGDLIGSDPTTLYGLNRWKPEPTGPELRDTKNPYNTRAVRGLTPTPIANPGIATIRAALRPQQTDYFFFVTGHDGKMYYAKTYIEHQRNVSKYYGPQ